MQTQPIASSSRRCLPTFAPPIFRSSRRHQIRYQSSTPARPERPALPPGQSKIYDLAVTYLSSQHQSALARLESLRSTSAPRSKLIAAEVLAYINDPSTRSAFRHHRGRGHMDKPVFRHLAEQRWVKHGGLDLLMQRVWQLKVVPDVLPIMGPTAPLTVTTSGEVEPGVFVSPSEFDQPPQTSLQLFHHPNEEQDEALYTFLVLDPDSPDPEAGAYRQHLQYAKTDIPLSVLSGETNLFNAKGSEVVSWEPPLPLKGTGTHRSIFLVLRQSAQATSPLDPAGFDLRDHLARSALDQTAVVGISVFRSTWSETEDAFIREAHLRCRGEEAVEYGPGPKEERYGYPLNAREAKKEEIRREAWGRVVQDAMISEEPRT